MKRNHAHNRPEPDITADMQMVLRGMRAAEGGWVLNAVLAWLLGRLLAQWFGQIATQIERMLQLLRSGYVWPVMKPVMIARGQAVGESQPAVSKAPQSGWLAQPRDQRANGFGSQDQADLPPATPVARRWPPVRRAFAMESTASTTSATACAQRPPMRLPASRGLAIRLWRDRYSTNVLRTPREVAILSFRVIIEMGALQGVEQSSPRRGGSGFVAIGESVAAIPGLQRRARHGDWGDDRGAGGFRR